MGGRDAAYQRNKVAAQWQEQLGQLRGKDPRGYRHEVTIYPDKGHWMDGEDAAAIDWMHAFTRNPRPKKVVWKQDDVTHPRFYWLRVDDENRQAGSLVTASIQGQSINLTSTGVTSLTLRFDDAMLDLDQPITITSGDKRLFQGKVVRRPEVLRETLAERGDPQAMFCAEVTVDLD